MKNPFPRLRSWYTANRKYDGFVAFVVFSFWTIFLLVGNILTDAKPIDWAIWIIWLQTVLYNASSWQNDKRHRDLFEFYEEMLRHSHESEYAAIENSEQYRRWLVAANRRRKRAEKKLRWYRKTLRDESANRLGFELENDALKRVIFDGWNIGLMAEIGLDFANDQMFEEEGTRLFNKDDRDSEHYQQLKQQLIERIENRLCEYK